MFEMMLEVIMKWNRMSPVNIIVEQKCHDDHWCLRWCWRW